MVYNNWNCKGNTYKDDGGMGVEGWGSMERAGTLGPTWVPRGRALHGAPPLHPHPPIICIRYSPCNPNYYPPFIYYL